MIPIPQPTDVLCSCCQEHPALYLDGQPLCETCSTGRVCPQCGAKSDEGYLWDEILCEDCEAGNLHNSLMEQTRESVVEWLESRGWVVDQTGASAQSLSTYYTVRWPASDATFEIRLSDHPRGASSVSQPDLDLRPESWEADLPKFVSSISVDWFEAADSL